MAAEPADVAVRMSEYAHAPTSAPRSPSAAELSLAEPSVSNGPGNGRVIAWLVYAGMLVALAYAGASAAADTPTDELFRYSTAVITIVGYALLALPVLLILRGQPKRELLALRPPAVSWRSAVAVALAIVVADLVFSTIYAGVFARDSDAALPGFWDGSRTGQFLASLVAIAVVAPVAEELMFRGVGYGLLERFGTATAITVTGVLFALMHGYVVELPVFLAYGFTLGWLRSWTRSVYPGMLGHGVTNAVACILAVAAA